MANATFATFPLLVCYNRARNTCSTIFCCCQPLSLGALDSETVVLLLAEVLLELTPRGAVGSAGLTVEATQPSVARVVARVGPVAGRHTGRPARRPTHTLARQMAGHVKTGQPPEDRAAVPGRG